MNKNNMMMTRFVKSSLPAILLLATVHLFAQQKQANFIGPEKGSLVIVGGGKIGPEIWERFVQLAGGTKAYIILIPTAGDDSSVNAGRNVEKEALQKLGAQVEVLHTRDPKTANTESFVAPLKKASGIWFSGGRQWRLADAYLNTLAHTAFLDLLNRGGVIGGTSAGATIQGSFLLRGDTKGNSILVGDHVQGLDLIHQVAIDQHILRRNRQFDLIEVIKARPELLGIGIDESTAIVVRKDTFDVIGNSYVAIYDARRLAAQTAPSSTEPAANGQFYFLGRGQQFNLKTRKVIPPVVSSQATSTASQ